jgi:hypothetical protein
MKKVRLVWVLAGLAALATVAAIWFATGQNDLSMAKAKVDQLPEGQAILGSAWPELQSVQLGDAFLYTIEVLYNPDQISGIDRDSLDNNVNLGPFEIRSTKETEFNLDSGARVYQRRYDIQLISGQTERLYEFPTIVVRYKLKDGDGFADASVVPEPVYVASRLPSDMSSVISSLRAGSDSPLRPLERTTEDASRNRLPWISWSLGGFLIILAVADFTLRVIPQQREQEKQAKEAKMSQVLYQACRSLKQNVSSGAKPRALFHQMDHILTMILVQKVKTGWLEEPDLDLVPDEIRPSAISLFDRCQKANRAEEPKQKDVDEALGELGRILNFYFAGEIEAWTL